MPGLAFTDLPPGSPFMFDNEKPVDIEPRSMATPMARVARIARGELSAAEHERLVDEATRLDPHWRGGVFNQLEYFLFRSVRQSAAMGAFLLQGGLHRPVPGSRQAPTAGDVEGAWREMMREREAALAWARSKKVLMEIVGVYRFERRVCVPSRKAHEAAARLVAQTDRAVVDPMAYAGACIEWAEREYREWFWRCAPNHQVL